MAIVKIGAPLSGIRGTIGGITYSQNKAGPYAKIWAHPSNPRTSRQTTERGYLSRMPGLWRSLSSAQRAHWDTFANLPAQALTNSLGVTYYISGYGWFTKCNIRLMRVGRATITAVPTIARPAAPTIDGWRVCATGTETDRCTGGTAAADSWHTTYVPANAFDDSSATVWISALTALPHWIGYTLATSQLIRNYSMQAGSSWLSRMPAAWTFEGWTGSSWDVLHSVIAEPAWSAWERRMYYLPDRTTTYAQYRINISQCQTGTIAQIAEVEFFKGIKGESVIVYPAYEFVLFGTYDLVMHVATSGSVGQAVQYPGHYEILAKQSPGTRATYCQDELEAKYGNLYTGRPWFARLYRQTTEGLRSAAQASRTETEE